MIKKLDSPKVIGLHKKIILKKSLLNAIYRKFYNTFKESKYPSGKVVEIGSGGGFLKNIMPSVITSDIIKGEGIDRVFSAEKIPFKKNTVAAFLCLTPFITSKIQQKR